jgi:diguanylate cyclase (GGDEF)-like protein/PAS domain S-box-containing protein
MLNLSYQPAVQSAQLQHMLSLGNNAMIVSTLTAAIFAYFQLPVASTSTVFVWLSLVSLVALGRFSLAMAYRRALNANLANVRTWLRQFRVGVVVAGVAWGSVSFFMFPANNPQQQMLLICMLAGLSAGGLITYSADIFSGIAYATAIMLPLIIHLFFAGDATSIGMSAASLLYLGFVIASMRHVNRNLTENITLRLDATAREQVVQASEERYRLLLNHAPAGIFHYDANLIITYCNDNFTHFMHNSLVNLANLDLKIIPDQSILPALRKALLNEIGQYEGPYNIAANQAESWITLTSAPSLDANGEVAGGIAIFQDISDRKQSADEIEKLAFYDTLTHLPNRSLLLDRLKHALAASARTGRDGALLFLDLDHFKTLNDTLGHAIGDLLLQQVATRLSDCLRKSDTVSRLARIGGDEFVVLLEDMSEQALKTAVQAEFVAEKILASLSQPYQLATHEYHCTVSIGVTLFTKQDKSVEDLLKQADIAMYQAKQAGRNTLRFFDSKMQDSINNRADTERELRRALERQQFELYYQVQVSALGRPLGAEALIRWLHPERGIVSPLEFIALAEETKLILPIGQWVLDTACRQLKLWQQDSLTDYLSIAINISALQFRQPNFAEQVKSAIQQHVINPALLKLELTESVLLENIEDTIATMSELNAVGIQFSLDDFGTGYSSLQYLRRLPINQLKIDQSFVRDIVVNSSDRSIVRTIIAMTDSLDLETIAEGVETEEQRLLLLKKGCMQYQGYLFGRPMPIAQFEAALKLA